MTSSAFSFMTQGQHTLIGVVLLMSWNLAVVQPSTSIFQETCDTPQLSDPRTYWQGAPEEHTWLYSDACNIHRLDAAQWGAYNLDGPVILVNVTDNAKFVAMTQRGPLIDKYGHTKIVLSSANTHSYEKVSRSLIQYLNANMSPRTMDERADRSFYHFGDNDYNQWVNFTTHYHRPPFTYTREPFFSFGLGGSGSGVPFHTHGAVFAEVLHGLKRWFVTAPDTKPDFDPNETSFVWVHKHYNATRSKLGDRLYECTLRPGEVLYIGHSWWHATLNIGESVFISTFL